MEQKPRPPAESQAEDEFRAAVGRFIGETREIRVQLKESEESELAAMRSVLVVNRRVEELARRLRSSIGVCRCPRCLDNLAYIEGMGQEPAPITWKMENFGDFRATQNGVLVGCVNWQPNAEGGTWSAWLSGRKCGRAVKMIDAQIAVEKAVLNG